MVGKERTFGDEKSVVFYNESNKYKSRIRID